MLMFTCLFISHNCFALNYSILDCSKSDFNLSFKNPFEICGIIFYMCVFSVLYAIINIYFQVCFVNKRARCNILGIKVYSINVISYFRFSINSLYHHGFILAEVDIQIQNRNYIST